MVFGRESVAAAPMSPEGEKLAAQIVTRRAQARADADRLQQKPIGENYEFDSTGELVGPKPDTTDVPQNRPFAEAASLAPPAELARVVRHAEPGPIGAGDETEAAGEDVVDRSLLTQSMLAYSTVRSATWASRRPDVGRSTERHEKGPAPVPEAAEERLLRSMERLGASNLPDEASRGEISGAARGGALYPATESPQAFQRGAVGDMRIGGDVGPDQIVRQGKFLDCALVNELKVDLVESPVIAMVSRDFISIDGSHVLVPAGSKLIGMAGTVQNLQQARVYIKFDRIVFPDQRSAYFPVRQVGAVDGAGAAGVPGKVDRHFALQFGAAVMLGMLDGLGAAVQGANVAGSPTARELVLARSSSNFSSVVAGVLQRYANVVPTVTVEAGAKLKVYFSEDVRVSPYMLARDLSWVR
jgi:type IV secretory pathway VirB10-like protein